MKNVFANLLVKNGG